MIDNIKQWLINNTDKYQLNSDDDGDLISPFIKLNDVGDIINDCIKDLSLVEADQWVSVHDYLPQPDFEVIVCCDDDVETAIFRQQEDGSYYFDGVINVRLVTHWMSKPEPKPPTV